MIKIINQKQKTSFNTKHSDVVEKIIAYEKKQPKLFGGMKGTISILGDITQPIDEPWEACNNSVI